MFVLDCSVTMAWCFEDEASEYADAVLECLKTQSAFVPALWHLEVMNVLLVGERRQRIDFQGSAVFLSLLQSLDIQTDRIAPLITSPDVMQLGREHQISSYDAVYLHLAMRERLSIATQDKKLSEAAKLLNIKFHP